MGCTSMRFSKTFNLVNMIPEQLQQEVAELIKAGHLIEMEEEESTTRVYIIFKGFELLPGQYNVTTTDLMVFTTTQYPSSCFDMFWVDKDLTLANGNIPKSAESIENYLSRQWRRFSIHPYQKKPWNPNEDCMTSYLTCIVQRLNLGK